MGKPQELIGNAASSAKTKISEKQSENYQLNNSNTEQNLNGKREAEIAYNAIDHHITYHKTQYSYDEQQSKYVEAAFNDYEQPSPELPPESGQSEQNTEFNRASSSVAENMPRLINNSDSSLLAGDSDSYGGLLSGTAQKYNNSANSLGVAEPPDLFANTYKLSQNEELINKLEDKRKYVQRGYTRLSLQIGDKKIPAKQRLQFNYYGKIRLSEKEKELLRIGRTRYESRIVREKMTRKDYNDRLKKKEKKAFKRRATGRLLFREGYSAVNVDEIGEDENTAALKHGAKRAARTAAIITRNSIKTLRLQNNVYARLEQANMRNRVLHDERERLYRKSDKAIRKQQLKEAQSSKQKHELKKKMAQQRKNAEGNFFRRTKQQFMVKKASQEYRRQAVKRTLSAVCSAAALFILIAIFLMILLLVFLVVTQGSAEYYAAAVTQNDYSTLSDATAYFRSLETDLDEYLNADRPTLEAELEATYGPDIYEFIYNLDEFGFSANTLIAYLSAVYGQFDLAMVQNELDEIFKEMYTLTIEVKIEDRDIVKYNPDTMEYYTVTEPKKICYITLEKRKLEEIVEARLPEELRFQYSGYHLSTGGQQVYAPVMQEDWTNLISSNYGERIHPITKVRTFHKGVDIAVPEGTKLYSAVKGVVVISQYSNSAGNYVTVQTDSGWKVTFMHMDSRSVSVGQTVEQGDFLGLSGNTGNSTGPHLHLQVENAAGETVNPIFIIPQTCANVQ